MQNSKLFMVNWRLCKFIHSITDLSLHGSVICSFSFACEERKGPCKRSNIVGPNLLRAFAHHVVCCYDLLEVVGWSLKLVKLQSEQVPTFLMFRGHQSVVQQSCVRLHSTSSNVAPAHAHYMPRIHTNTCEQEIKMASEMENVPESFVFPSKDPTRCDLLRTFARIG